MNKIIPRFFVWSTGLKKQYPQGHFIVLLNPGELRLYQARPKRLELVKPSSLLMKFKKRLIC